jgi:hypothetical protein
MRLFVQNSFITLHLFYVGECFHSLLFVSPANKTIFDGSFGLQHRVVWQKFTNVSEVLAASIIRPDYTALQPRKTAIFVLTTVRTSNPTKLSLLLEYLL